MSDRKPVFLGVVGAPHSVKGAFRVKSFTETPQNISAYGPVCIEKSDRVLTLRVLNVVKANIVLATAKEITDRDAAAALTGRKIFVDRDRLPQLDDEDDFYIDDLVGLRVAMTGAPDDEPAGHVAAVHDFGAGDLLEIRGATGRKTAILIRFTKENVPDVDISNGVITVSPTAFAEEEDDDTPPPPATDDDPR